MTVSSRIETSFNVNFERLQAAEELQRIANDPRLTDQEIRNMDFRFQGKGVGCVEACITLYAIEIRENTIFTKGLSHAIEEIVPSVIKQIVSDLK